MGRTHAEAIKLAPGASLTAVWGGMRASRLASDYGVNCKQSLPDLIRSTDIDAIVVTTPHYTHTDEAMMAIESGKTLLLERDAIADLANRSQISIFGR